MSHDGGLKVPSPEELATLPPDGGPNWNRLVFESSPYLLQHAANPVDWYPWGQEAFDAAKERDLPLFVSIGYATCHWCHVMERESFEDEQVAALMNEAFICIKVDKEERPDIDDIYMTACQALTGHGGWPLTVVLTHTKQPFFAGTYYPKHSRQGRIGMMDLVPRIGAAWKEQRDELINEAAKITEHVRAASSANPGESPAGALLEKAYAQLDETYDEEWGGFGSRPKFPTPHNYTFLLRYYHLTGEKKALEMVCHSLRMMRLGGMFDHVGFGFHRYATDAYWHLPHFEKMLYDQAMLAMANLEAGLASGDAFFYTTASEIFTYVLRDMTAPEGGFYSAEDADSEGEEGKFYVWTKEEIWELLGKNDGDIYCAAYHFQDEGNFLDEATHERNGTNIPTLGKTTPAMLAQQLGLSEESTHEGLEAYRQRLFEVREKRIHPLKDDKILTDWNGLMIAALAMGGRILGEQRYVDAAVRAAQFIANHLTDDAGNLMKRGRLGKAGLNAHLDDYAFLTWGLLEIHQATQDHQWLTRAIELTDKMVATFHDGESGAFYFANDPDGELILRGQKIYDGAIPSGNSVAACNLIRLYRLTGDGSYEDLAMGVYKAFAGGVEKHPVIATQLLSAVDMLLGSGNDIVISGKDETADAMITALNSLWLPGTSVIHLTDEDKTLETVAPHTAAFKLDLNQTKAYVCSDFTCKQPVTDPQALVDSLR